MPRKFRSKPRTGGRRTRRRFKRKSMRRRKARRDAPTRVVTKVLGGFPDRYFCRLKAVNAETQVSLISSTTFWSFYGNSIATGVGPSKQGGAYEANVPAGVQYLLGTATDEPAHAPYIFCRVWGSSIKISYTPTPDGPTVVTMVVFPALIAAKDISPSGSTTGFNVTGEQAYSKIRQGPGAQTSKPMIIKSFMSTRKIFGLHKAAVEGNPNFYHFSTTNPPSPWFWNLYIYGDGSTNLSGSLNYEITYYVEFFGRSNQLSSALPS